MNILAIDNGSTGSVAYVSSTEEGQTLHFHMATPSFSELDYTLKERYIGRINVLELVSIISRTPENTLVVMERPMINPVRFKASIVAARAFEATIIAAELAHRKRMVVDSRSWQKPMLGKELKGMTMAQRKELSTAKAGQLFSTYDPRLSDGDAVLMAAFYSRLN